MTDEGSKISYELLRRQRDRVVALEAESLPKSISTEEGGGAPEDTGMANPTREELAAAIAAAEARAETKLARVEGKLDLVLESVRASREEARDNRRAVIANLWVIFGALAVIVGILYTVAPVLLDLGFKWREVITKEIQEQVRPH